MDRAAATALDYGGAMSFAPTAPWIRRLAVVTLVAGAAGALIPTQTGCGLPPTECTLIGCTDGLRLRVLRPNGTPASDFRGTVTWDGEPRTFQCSSSPSTDDNFNCTGNEISFDTQALPRALELRIDPLPDGSRFEGTITLPEPVQTQPNGPGCAPICRFTSAEVTLQAP